MNIFQKLFCVLTWYLAWPIFKVLTRFKVEKPAGLDFSGPIIITANHPSLLDPFLIGLSFWPWHSFQPFYFMTADGLIKSPIGPLLRAWGAFSVNRGKGLEYSLKKPQELLDKKQSVLIFPQGKRVNNNQKEKIKIGAAVLALRNHSPILPIKIIDPFPGSLLKLFLRKRKIQIIIGQPYYLSNLIQEQDFSREDYFPLAEIIFEKINQLK